MKINMPMTVTAADTVKRTISGTIVTWNEQGNTSVGPTVFAADSIEIKPVKLLLEHDRTRPIGKMVSHEVTASGIVATFKIANTMAGEDALVEATEGLRDGFSVGAQINEWTNQKGVMQITSATLDEVSLVTDPAIDSARVSEVAASENEAPKEDSAPATAEAETPTEGEQVSDTTAPAPAVEEAVEAAKVETVSASRPAFYTRIHPNSTEHNSHQWRIQWRSRLYRCSFTRNPCGFRNDFRIASHQHRANCGIDKRRRHTF